MEVLIKGHKYALDNLKDDGETYLQFYMDPTKHNGQKLDGTSCQEVLRALIHRVKCLNDEKPWDGNAAILGHLRQALAGFEARAILRKAENGYPVEDVRVDTDGHFALDI